MMCSTCHDQHRQTAEPFGPAVPAYAGPGTGAGRHFQRIDNSRSEMCVDCHAARNVASASLGSHPVGVTIPGGKYRSPSLVPLDALENRVRCQSCHVVHNAPAANGALARVANTTALCTDCHTLADTASPASHMSATAGVLWPGGQYGSAFPQITDTSARGSCANCHQPHGWPNAANISTDYPRLLVDAEEKLCFTCHDTNGPARRSLQPEFAKASVHPVASFDGVHAPGEAAISQTRHVECDDCHNSHQSKARVSVPGASTTRRPATGPLAGVRGVDVFGSEVNPAQYEFEICLRCHGDSPGKPAGPTPRQFTETNVRLEFGGSYPSYHAVAAAGRNASVPSLLTGWSAASYLSCTSCHNNNAGPANGGTGPNGSHGSTNARMLERTYTTADNTTYSQARYSLCFKCHSATSIIGNQSFKEHSKHISSERTPCNVCHDPHASSGASKLINFDTRVVTAYGGKIEYRSTGTFRGQCTLTCHGAAHNAWSY